MPDKQPPVLIVQDPKVLSWPAGPDSPPPNARTKWRAKYVPLARALSSPYKGDVHLARYSVPALPARLRYQDGGLEAALKHAPDGIPIVLFTADVDSPGHIRCADCPQWVAAEKAKIAALQALMPGVFAYFSRSGYWLVAWLTEPPVLIRSEADTAAWRLFYCRNLLWLRRTVGIEADLACKDWTRICRVPHATRADETAPEANEVIGDPESVGLWTHRPSPEEDDLQADLQTAEEAAAEFRSRHSTARSCPYDSLVWAIKQACGLPSPLGLTRQPAPATPIQEESELTPRARAALAGECDNVRTAPDGSRHTTIYTAALKLGHLVAAGELDQQLVTDALHDSAAAAGYVAKYGPADTERVIRDGLEVGKQTLPRTRPLQEKEKKRPGPPRPANEEDDFSDAEYDGRPPPAITKETVMHSATKADSQLTSTKGPKVKPTLFLNEKTGKPLPTLANIMAILTQDHRWDGVFGHDVFSDRSVIAKTPPFAAEDTVDPSYPTWLTDSHVLFTLEWLAYNYGLHLTSGMVYEAIQRAVSTHKIHPVKELIEACQWDGKYRVSKLLVTYFGANDDDYTNAVSECLLISAIARIYSPGCKVDTIVVLEGPQGQGKSSALQTLFGPFFGDTGLTIGEKDAYQAIQGVWCHELAELASIRSAASIEKVKNFVTSQVDHYRPSYGRCTVHRPRQTIFVGTVNDSQYLADRTGNRRFLPIQCTKIDLAALAADRGQLLAEALLMFQGGRKWWLEGAVEEMARAEQSARVFQDDWVPTVEEWLKSPGRFLSMNEPGHPMGKPIKLEEGIRTLDALTLAVGIEPARIGQNESNRMGRVLRECGLERKRLRLDNRPTYLYFPAEPAKEAGPPPKAEPAPQPVVNPNFPKPPTQATAYLPEEWFVEPDGTQVWRPKEVIPPAKPDPPPSLSGGIKKRPYKAWPGASHEERVQDENGNWAWKTMTHWPSR